MITDKVGGSSAKPEVSKQSKEKRSKHKVSGYKSQSKRRSIAGCRLLLRTLGKAEKLEQFIYRFTPVRCLLISILKGCNTVFLLNFKIRLLILKCLHMSCLVALAPMGKVTSQFVILTQTVNNQLLSLSWGVLFFPFTFGGSGEG